MLLYDPLIKLDDSLNPVNHLADSIETDGKRITVTLKNVKFTDGTALTASDVYYSIKQAKKSDNKYKKQLENIKSYTVVDSKTIVFDLGQSDPYYVNMLDFPIFKNGTAETKDSNDRVIPPIGCGRYLIDKTNGYRLIANKGYYLKEPSFDYISLIDTPDDESLDHMVEVNAIDMIYSELDDNKIPKMNGTQTTVNQTNTVFLGLNSNNPLLSKDELRAAISSALSRTEIAGSAYFGFATPATGIFPSAWKETADLQHIAPEQNIEQVVAYLEQLGYNSKDTSGYYIDTNGERITFSLVYNKENLSRKYAAALISQQLKKAGIEIVIEEAETFDEYKSKVNSGDFDMYIGEIKLDKSMNLRDVFNDGVIYGVKDSYTGQMVNAFYNNTADISTVISSFIGEMPFIPLCCRQGVLVYSDEIDSDPSVSISDIYADL